MCDIKSQVTQALQYGMHDKKIKIGKRKKYIKRNDKTKEFVTSHDTTMHSETTLNRWNSYDDVAFTKFQWRMIHFDDIGTTGGNFDSNYIDNISEIESSKRMNENKSSDSNSSYNESNSNENMDSSNKTDGGDNVLRIIKLTCELNDISEHKKFMTSS